MSTIAPPTLPIDISLDLYRVVYMIRRCEEVIVRIYPDDNMKTPMHMSMGQEAVSVGVCKALQGNSDVIASYRSHATYLAQTGDHGTFFGELHGRTNGTADGKSGSMHLADIPKGMLGSTGIVAAGIPVAVGAAFANQQMHPGRLTAAFFGDGATDEAAFWESLNASCLMELPILFVCEDNDFAVHTRKAQRKGFNSLSDVVRQFNCCVFEDDSNDVEAIYSLTGEAVKRVMAERRPAFLNIRTYRYLEPCGIAMDSSAPYRTLAEDSFWKQKDCVALQRRRLIERGVPTEALIDMEDQINASIEASVAAAITAPHPSADQLRHGVFYENN